MDTIFKWIKGIGGLIHWLTGWVIHPSKGGCCDTEVVKDNAEKIFKK